jgi:hypothetical protein
MIKHVVRAILAAVILGSAAMADEVPQLDVSQTCRAEASTGPSDNAIAACLADEQKAHEQLTKDWEGFAPAVKSSCRAEATDIAGIKSYVELLTCLQIARDAAKLPEE